MSLLLAPYNHAMRLGQGFNSYTQQICIDDAVVVDEQRAENVVTNDGTTMRIMAQKNAQPSAWTRQKEVVVGQPATAILVENAKRAKEEVAIIEEEMAEEAAEKELEEDISAGGNKQIEDKESSEVKKPAGEPSGDDSGSVDDVADADEARRADTEGKSEPTKPEQTENSAKDDAIKASDGDSASTAPTEPKGDLDTEDPEAIETNLKGNATNSDKAQRDLITANLRANSGKPAAPKRPVQRSNSSGRARQTVAPASPPNRAAIRKALAEKNAADAAAKAAKDEAETTRRQAEEAELLAERRRDQKALELQQRKDEMERRAEDRDEQRAIRTEKRAWDAKRREDARKAIGDAANLKATSLQDLERIRAQNQFVERFSGMAEQTGKYDFDPTAPRGPSQNVTYTSRFVDRLSDVTEDMSVSASLSIKAGKVGGSGKGSFVDSDKFKESDLNFYISVKVINQTINFKDPLVYNPLPNIDKDQFREVYGDSFISGFVEGGEFNAVVSMKILNKAKKSDIQAEAKVALTVGPVDVSGEANLGIARSNIQTNTETTIQVSWSGGGHIKPMEQQWDIHSLMQAAARFPDLVADCPQRTYAILTKYDALRSFVAKKPASYTPLQYETAQIYTSTLLDSFVSYKSLYKRLGEQIYGIQTKVLEISPWGEEEKKNIYHPPPPGARMGKKDLVSGLYPLSDIEKYFEDSITGLSDARTAVRRQMARIVNEVDLMEKNPKLATDEDHEEPYQSPVAFEARLPIVDAPERLRVRGNPLSGKRLVAKTFTEEEQRAQLEKEEKMAEGGPLFTGAVDAEEQAFFEKIHDNAPDINRSFRASGVVGDSTSGKMFNNLDFLKPDWNIRSIRVEMAAGALVYLAVSYDNGLLVEKGVVSQDKTRVKKFGNFGPGERINSAQIEHGRRQGKDTPRQVLGLRLFTNRGRSLIARALNSESVNDVVNRDGVAYEEVKVQYVDLPFNSGTIKGFFGRSDDGADGKIYRLGIIWCRLDEVKPDEAEANFSNAGDVVDLDDIEVAGNARFESLKQRLATAEQQLEKSRASISASDDQLAKSRQDVVNKENRINELERLRKPVMEAQCGSFTAGEKGWPTGLNANHRCDVTFPRSYLSPPKLLFGLSAFDMESNKPRCTSLASAEISPGGFTVHAATWADSVGYRIDCNWMTLPDDLHLETGMLYTGNGFRGDWTQEIFFSQSFATPPVTAVWIQEFEFPNNGWMSMVCSAEAITKDKFTLRVASWAGRLYKQLRVQYLAYPAEEDGGRVKSGRTSVTGAQGTMDSRLPYYGRPFSKEPATFIAVCKTDFNSSHNTRFRSSAKAIGNKEIQWSLGTWSDTEMYWGECQWIAIE